MLADDKMKNCLVWDIACLVNPIKPGTFWTFYHLGGWGGADWGGRKGLEDAPVIGLVFGSTAPGGYWRTGERREDLRLRYAPYCRKLKLYIRAKECKKEE